MQSKTNTLIILLFTLLLTSCGGGGGGGGSASAAGGGSTDDTVAAGSQTGSVGILITDGFTDDFDAVNITVTKAELLSDDGRVTIFSGSETINLLNYRNDSRLFSLNDDVAAGTYNKIRLTLSNIELIKCESGAVITPIDIESCINTIADDDQPRLNGNKKLDLNPRGDFYVGSDAVLMIEIDIDAEKSIHIVETGNGKYKFRPVVFVNIIGDDVPAKLVRIKGIIDDLDLDNSEFEICSLGVNLLLAGDDDKAITCIDIRYSDQTSFFTADGSPTGPDDLMNGDTALVVGRMHINQDDDVEHHDDDADNDSHDIEGVYLEAVVIRLGDDDVNNTLDGIALTTVDIDRQFSMSINPGQGFTDDSAVTVQIQENTKILNKMGESLPDSAIEPGVPVSIDGELQVSESEPALLIATLIVVDTDDADTEKLRGIIGLIPDEVCGFALQTDVGDRSVSTSAETIILRVSNSDDSGTSDIIRLEDLMPGDDVDVFGQFDSEGCFNSNLILVFTPDVELP